MGGDGGDGPGEGRALGVLPLVGVPFGRGLAMLAKLRNGLLVASEGGVVLGVVVRD